MFFENLMKENSRGNDTQEIKMIYYFLSCL